MALSPFRRCRRSATLWMSLPFMVGILLASLRTAQQLVELMSGDGDASPFSWSPELRLSVTSKVVSIVEEEGPPPVIATAIIVEMRCHSAFSVALHGAVRNLGPEVLILVMHSARNGAFVRGVIDSSHAMTERFRGGGLALRQIREEDWGVKCPEPKSINCGVYTSKFWYSKMFINSRFWKSFETPYVLTLQSDTLLCRQFPTRQLIEQGTSFTGGLSGIGPGFNKRYTPVQDPRNGVLLRTEYLNGGMSFRNVRWVKDCIAKYRFSRAEGWIEDEFYRHCRENGVDGTVHATEVGAYNFSSDNGVTMCFSAPAGERVCPLGVHKPWSEGADKREQYQELERNCPGLPMLQKMNKRGHQRGEMCRAYDLEGFNTTTFRCNCTPSLIQRKVPRRGRRAGKH